MKLVFSPDYDSYINSDMWRVKAERRREIDGNRCFFCKRKWNGKHGNDNNLHVHHMTYTHFGDEDIKNELITVCEDCHEKIHESWDSLRDGIYVRQRLISDHELAKGRCELMNALMPHDISFGGEYWIAGDTVKVACKNLGIELKANQKDFVTSKFATIHLLDTIDKLRSGKSRTELVDMGYSESMVYDVDSRKQSSVHDKRVRSISDEVICYLHEGEGEWIVVANEYGLEIEFDVRFMPSIRYPDDRWRQ